ncbi:MAG TPA: PAS domain S-box protein, partial [Tepidisphaeraceae bacterium]|nr:PAS domain S-box protein [Tepidisphaeraceae bacterium]
MRGYGILDTPGEQAFDDLVRLVAHVCQTPVAVINFIDRDRQWFKSELGLGVRETPLDASICAHAILERELLIVPDTQEDERFKNNPLVVGEPYLRFYAGALLKTGDGHALGTLCVLDHRPRDLTDSQQEALRALARQVMSQLELRRALVAQSRESAAREEAEAAVRQSEARFAAMFEASLDCIVGMDHAGRVTAWNAAAEQTFGYSHAEAVGQEMARLIIPPALREAHRNGLARYLARGEGPILGRRIELTAIRKSGDEFPVELTISPVSVDGVQLFRGQLRDLTERKRAEAALRHATEATEAALSRWQAVVGCMADGVVVADAAGNLPEWNAAALEMHGYASLDEVRKHLNDFPEVLELTSDDGRVVPLREWPMSRVLRGETFLGYEVGVRRLDAELQRVISYSGSPVLDDHGQVVLAVLTLHDVTAQRRAQGALRSSEELVRTIAENSTQGLAMMNERGYCTYANKSWLDMTGYSAEKIGSRPLHDLVHHHYPDGRPYPMHECPIDRALPENFDVRAHEDLFFRKDGSAFPVLVAASPIFRDGRPVSTVIEIRDVTDALRDEAALRESEQRLRAVFEQTEAGIAQADLTGRFVLANDRYAQIVGRSHAELLDLRMQDITHPDDLSRNLGLLQTAVGDGKPFVIEKRYVRPDGSEVWVSNSVSLMKDRDGQPSGVIAASVDITDRKRAEADRDRLLEAERAARTEAERAGRMKDEFLATLSHELRTPLNAILGWSQIVKRPSASTEDMAQGIGVIERNARAQAQIIEDLLDMSRIISGKVRLDVQRLSLEPILRAAVESATPAADAKGIRVQAVLDPLAGPVNGDPARLQQVFWNLLTNAVKFTPRGGRVQVVFERVNSHLEVSVADTGEGIAPEFLPHVFDRFRQADASTTRRHGGLGLGLSIAKQLVELHGGSVRAKSAGEGQGATFIVSLPLAVIHPESQPEPDRRHPKAGGEAQALLTDMCADIAGVKVLVVDDEPDARTLVRRLLEDCNAVVFTAATAAEGMEVLQAERPDVVVSDIGLPTRDGYEFMKQVRALAEDRG